MNPLFSIVMPVYGVEKYLERAISCFLKQTYSDFELILVDDCSPDNCPRICDTYKERDSRISVLHLSKNGGLSNARNQGLTVAKGQYILFPDSDDYVDLTLLEDLHSTIEESKPDVIVFGTVEEYEDEHGNIIDHNTITYEAMNLSKPEDIATHVIRLEQKTLYGYAWNKCYKRFLFETYSLQFTKITLIEDIVFNIQTFDHVQNISILSSAPYHYMKRLEGSLTGKFLPDYYQLSHKRVELLYDQFQRWGSLTPSVKQILGNILGRYFYSALMRNCDPRAKMSHRDRINWTKSALMDPIFMDLRTYMNDSALWNVLYLFVKKDWYFAALATGRVFYWIKGGKPTFFMKLKKQRR